MNALEKNWAEIVPPSELSYILGNPPFVGSKLLNDEQRVEMDRIFAGVKGNGVLDYVSAWYLKAAQYIQDTNVQVAFVSTKSITQGEQVGVLWGPLLNRYHVKIQFAHRTFKWSSEARGRASVHCIIVGFGLNEPTRPVIFDYQTPESEAYKVEVKHINPYLVDAPDVILFSRPKPLSDAPSVGIGNKPIDGGNYLFTGQEKDLFLMKEPKAAKYMKPWIGSDEFINGYQRYCLWLGDILPEELRSMPEAMKRVEAVRQFRLASNSKPTQRLAGKRRPVFMWKTCQLQRISSSPKSHPRGGGTFLSDS